MTLFLLFLLSSWFSGIVLQDRPTWMRYLFLLGWVVFLCYAYLYTSKM